MNTIRNHPFYRYIYFNTAVHEQSLQPKDSKLYLTMYPGMYN